MLMFIVKIWIYASETDKMNGRPLRYKYLGINQDTFV